MQMSNLGKLLFLQGAGVGMVEGEGEVDVLHGHPSGKKDHHVLIDLAVRTRDVLVATSVIEEVRRRLLQFRGESKAEKEKVEKEAESKVEEKTRAAAWAWYQHGNSVSPPVVSPSRRVVPHCSSGRKASRFKTEALKVGSVSGRVESRWGFETSLFDSYELDSVSQRIDHAFHENGKPLRLPARTSQTKLTRSHSLRLSFPRSLCRSISDVVTQEEMALSAKKDKYCKEKPRRPDGGWSFRKISKAMNSRIQVPAASDSQAHEQHQLHHHEHHHHHHQHEHEHHHHHHHHYSVKIKDASQYAVYR